MTATLEIILNLADGTGAAVTAGSAVFTANAPVISADGTQEFIPDPITIPLSSGTPPVAQLIPTDVAGNHPAGWAWQVAFPGVPGGLSSFSFFAPGGPASFTAASGTPGVFTWTPTSALTSLPNGTGIRLSGGSLPAGFTAGTVYYVVAASGSTFELAATPAGTAIAATGSGSGSLTVFSYYLSALVPVTSPAAIGASLPLPPGTPVTGQVPVVAVVSPLAMAWGAGGSGGGAVSSVFGRTGTVAAASGDYAVGQVTGAAPLASPALTGTPTAPTATAGDNSTKIATTAFVTAAGVSSVFGRGGTVTAQSGDYSVGQVTGAAPLANPTFTGTVTVPTPASSGAAVTKAYADAIAQGLSVKPSVQEATAVALPSNTYSNGASGVGATLTATANGALTVDGITVAVNDRVLVQNEATGSHNGIYVTTAAGSGGAPYVLTRAADLNTAAQVPGAFVFVEQGTVNTGAGFAVASPGPFTIGTTAIAWTQFSGAGEITAGSGLSKSGNTLSVAATAVTPGSYTAANITVAADGRVTAAANGSAGGGTVTSASVVTANGLAGTVANPASTPAITLSTTVSGVLKGNGTAISAATAGTDYLTPSGSGAALTGITAGQVGAVSVTGGGKETVSTNSTASGAVTLALASGNVFNLTLTGNVTSLTVTGATNGVACSFTLYVTQDGTGGRTFAWMSGVTWLSGSAPVMPSTAGAVSAYVFESLDGGTTWFGSAVSATSPLPVAQGGTGAATQQAALNALAGAVTAGFYPRGNGTNVVMSAVQAADLPAATTSVQGAVIIDGTAGDIQPSPAARAAGSVGKPADAGHVHGQPAFFAPTGLTGATAASRYAGATAAGPPQSGTFATGDWVVDQSALIWICTAGGTPGTWTRSGDKPYQFRPETYGAVRDGKLLTDGAMTSGSNILACTTSTPFTSADVGKWVLVWAAATASTYLFKQITGFTDSGHVTLSGNAGNTVTASGVLYGTDDTAAIQSAVSAAAAYSLGGNGTFAQVLLSSGIYCSATAAALGTGTTLGNAAITIPIVNAGTGVKAQVQITGAGSSQLPHWLQANPCQSGSIIAAMRTDGSLNTTYGPTSIIGGPVNGYGGGGGTFSNMHMLLKGFTVLVPMSTGAYCGPDLYGIGQATVDDVSYLPLAVVPTGTPWPALATYGSPTYYPSYSFGLRMPSCGNNAVSDIGSFTSYFTQISLIGSEHCNFTSLKTLYSQYGILPMTNTGGTVSHGICGLNWCCEAVRYPVGSLSSGYFTLSTAIGITVVRLELESYTDIVLDGASKLYGELGFNIINSAGSYLATQYGAGGTGVKLKRLEAAQGPVASPAAAPATTVAWPNYYYRDAWITLSATTITAVSIDAVAQNGLAGSPATYTFFLPSGHSYTPTYTGTLTHTVCLA